MRDAVTFLGQVGEADKARLLRTVDVYVAPNLGGESFGIILVEAMAAGAPVLASDLDAFRRVLDDGRVGVLFPAGDVAALAAVAAAAARRRRPAGRAARRPASAWVRRYDWATVASDLLAVYETVGRGPARSARPSVRPWRDRLRR